MKHDFYDRFKLVLSDPINSKIDRVPDAGTVSDGLVTMCTGLKIKANSYYGPFSDIFLLNGGVHEPSEEFIFYDVIKKIKKESPIMIELGSYWAYYGMCFLQENPSGKCFLVESSKSALNVGVEHFNINNFKGTFVEGMISNNHIKMDNFLVQYSIPKVDIVLADIQGYEYEMLLGSENILKNKLVDYFFISTHDQNIHHLCLNFLIDKKYKILASADFDYETFCYDGIIVACSEDVDASPYELYNRSKTEIISDEMLDSLFKNNLKYC
jgi:hypothetical protein